MTTPASCAASCPGPVWQYKNGHNLLIFSPKKKKPPQIVYLLAAVASALLLGSLFSLCAPQLGAQLSEQLLQPLFSTLGGLLTAVASVLVFLSLVSGILGIGDVASFGKIGKTMFGRILLLPLMLVLCYSVLIAPLFPISIGSQFSGQLADLLAMVLNLVLDSMVTPFTTGNLLQIAFMSVLVGLAMLVLGAKVSALSTFVEQANSLFQIIMEGVCSYVPIMVFLSLFDLIVSGSIAQLSGAYKPLVLIILGCIFCMGVYFLLCLRNKVPPLVLAKKLLPAFLVGLITASTASALPLVMEGAPKKTGRSGKSLQLCRASGTRSVHAGHCAGIFRADVVHGGDFRTDYLCVLAGDHSVLGSSPVHRHAARSRRRHRRTDDPFCPAGHPSGDYGHRRFH